jgi:hypothetical protein
VPHLRCLRCHLRCEAELRCEALETEAVEEVPSPVPPRTLLSELRCEALETEAVEAVPSPVPPRTLLSELRCEALEAEAVDRVSTAYMLLMEAILRCPSATFLSVPGVRECACVLVCVCACRGLWCVGVGR